MAVSGVSSSSGAGNQVQGSTTQATSAFDTDTFMQLLLAELKHQDPLEPMDNNQLVGQMAQLNSLQQLTSISSNIETMKGYLEAFFGISS